MQMALSATQYVHTDHTKKFFTLKMPYSFTVHT